MKIALCTTTIHKPVALKMLRRCVEGNVKFFVALDKNSDFTGISTWGDPDDSFCWMTPDWQKKFKCSELLGWKTLARRNTAFLAALEWGADIIYSHDDDNLAVDHRHFKHLRTTFGVPPFTGIKVGEVGDWFDPGTLLIPETPHRGIPHAARGRGRHASPVAEAKVGVAAGLVIGDPDIDSTTRMELKPNIGSVHILGSTGVVVDPHCWTVWNSQNTAVVREFIPSWFMAPGCGRHDDIFASQIVQRIMRERGYHVHFGPPFTLQQRNPHDLIVDLRAELDGMSNVAKMAETLDRMELPGKSVVEDTRFVYERLSMQPWYPMVAVRAAMAWLEDCESLQ